MEKLIEKAKVLIEALPYIKEFYGKKVVIKYGGAAMKDENIKKTVIQDIVLMKLVGICPIIVHGGGPEINKTLTEMNIEPQFINGFRVTDKKTMEVVEMVLAGKTNKDLVSNLQINGINAVGLCGKDGNTLIAEKTLIEGHDNGYVGEVTKVNTKLINTLIDNDFIPVIAPIGTDEVGNTYNVNADYAAVAVAAELEAQKLVFMTDVKGVLKSVDDDSSLINRMSLEEAYQFLEDKTISGGMIPKVNCCIEAVKKGVKRVHILDGRVEHSLLLEVFTEKGVGTMFHE